jgi:replication factor C subunit 2/4
MSKIPWIEKYRPKNLSNIILHEEIGTKLEMFSTVNLPNIILFGQPGVGKTTSALAIVKKVLPSLDDFIELNASDNRGINMINDLVQNFCKNTINKKLKIIILDEADNITKKAQQQLINFIENYKNIRIIFTCNDIEQIIEPLQSRCLLIPFNRPSVQQIKQVIENILQTEKIEYDVDQLEKIIISSEFDFRKSISNCEAIYYSSGAITSESVNNYLGVSIMEKIINVLSFVIKSQDVDTAIDNYLELVNEGLNNLDFLTSIINLFQNSKDYDYILEHHKYLIENNITILEKTHIAYHKCVQTVESNVQIVGYLYSLVVV